MTFVRTACLAVLLAAGARAEERVRLHVDASQAEAVLSILASRKAGQPVTEAQWERLFAAEPYRRLKRRETELKRAFDDAEFRQFVLSEALLGRAPELERTLADWKRVDLVAAAVRVLDYLPPQARIRAAVYPVIKPRTNSFVFEVRTDPGVFLYLDPALTAAQFENTVSHELHHIGLASVSTETDAALAGLPVRARRAAEWMGAFGEGLAMLAAAGGPGVHPHAHSAPEDRARWERDVAAFATHLQAVERFFLDVIDGRLATEEQAREQAFTFYGVQGPWYTVGWKMAAVVEQRYGRQTLIACMLDPRRLLATYNAAVAGGTGQPPPPLWSPRLLEEVGARPAAPARR
jgi:hypothetical protein